VSIYADDSLVAGDRESFQMRVRMSISGNESVAGRDRESV
jgi:hypothetical protein